MFNFVVANAAAVFCAALALPLLAQSPAKPASAAASSVEGAIELAAKGQCRQAVPALKRAIPRVVDKTVRYRASMALARCAMSLDQTETAVQALWTLNREFSNDPEVLYVTTHYYSQLATRASQRLATVAPSSYQVHELEAEADESQGKWSEAIDEYAAILRQNPNLPGIHYRLGRIQLSKPETPTSSEQAVAEFQAELRIDPANASAEFFLGEIERRAGHWNEAIAHFQNAATIDPGFSEAFLALGMSLNSAERFAEAIKPLETYVETEPSDPAGHYQVSIAYARTGRREQAMREMSIQQEIVRKNPNGPPAPGASVPQ